MPSRRRAAVGVLTVALALAAPTAPAVGASAGGPLVTGNQAPPAPVVSTAGKGSVTPAMQREIDRVVNAGRVSSARRAQTRPAPADLVRDEVRCAELEGQRYCLHSGWTERSQAAVVTDLSREAARSAARRTPVAGTGGLGLLEGLRRHAALPPGAQAAAERRELVDAAASVAKVWMLRHEIEGEPLPAGFLNRHPEVQRTTTSPTTSRTARATSLTSTGKTNDDYRERKRILNPTRVASQSRTYWCGPASMQMIAWGWSGTKQSQDAWANRLGTTTSGSAITQMVRVTNAYTGWDNAAHAGRYISLDISNYGYSKWMLLNMRHYVDYRAPVILHPVLLKTYYPYLDDDASGHFQVGRGYDKRGRKVNHVSYFEPWNQQRFDPSEPYIARVQWRNAYKSFRANKAHFQQNIGV